MLRQLLLAATAVAALSMSACSSDAEPTGQVVATVDGVEITQSELNAEIGGMRGRNADEQKLIERAALQNIISRSLLAGAARERELDKSPDGAMTRKRAEQMALIALLEKSVVAQTPSVSDEEVDDFIAENPQLFDQRRIFLVEQIAVNSNTPKLLKDLEPLTTMAEVQAYLASVKLPGQLSFGVIDALQTDPAITKQIIALAPDAVFVLPQGDSLRINRIRDTQMVPVTGNDAKGIAKQILIGQRRQQQLASTVQNILKSGQAKVKYGEAFKPTPAPAKKPAAS